MSFRVFAEVEGRSITIDIVDVMTFNDAGKIADVKAYWGAENISVVN
jgi:steroid delta-isomerase